MLGPLIKFKLIISDYIKFFFFFFEGMTIMNYF